ncbi:unnamed protein product [Porites evermanni]|uniref:C2H2-type domain-containing protein n=1 Tax=Porites evermanni TaxID=104178 RepID=A0ABN8RLK1_9CNID|nr:unnamed protein product [Porites evermanni]
MTTAQVVEMYNSPIQDYDYKDNHASPTYEVTPGFIPLIVLLCMLNATAVYTKWSSTAQSCVSTKEHAPASNDVTAPVALDIITAITCVSDSCHTCASKSSNIPSPSSHQMIQLKSWVCHLQLMSPSCLKECRTSFTVLCIVPDNKGIFEHHRNGGHQKEEKNSSEKR